MASATVRDVFDAIRAAQRAIGLACAEQGEGWRHEVVRRRRELAELIGQLGTRLAGVDQTPAVATARDRLSDLRARLAEHQASWPAVAIETDASSYQASTLRLRAAYDALERAIAAFDRPLSAGDTPI